jgi:SsrA-binding protein
MVAPERTERTLLQNRKARYEYHVEAVYQAGIVLQGTEVKSLRAGKTNLTDAYAAFPTKHSNELFLLGWHINPYDFGNRENHEPTRMRKLLLHEHELKRIRQWLEEKGLTAIPLRVYFSGAIVKVELGMCKGKHLYDKRETTKHRDIERQLRRDRD